MVKTGKNIMAAGRGYWPVRRMRGLPDSLWASRVRKRMTQSPNYHDSNERAMHAFDVYALNLT